MSPSPAIPPSPALHAHWRGNLAVCAVGSFTTIIGMTLIPPILPLYVRDLGAQSTAEITLWSGIAYAATFATAALTAPLWGHLGDRFGRKSMLIRASLGMALAMSLSGSAQNVTELVLLRLLAGLLGGYASGSMILVAAQTPRERSAWALGTLASAIMAGNVAGPLLGGTLSSAIGVQNTFLATGALIFLGFVGTLIFLREAPRPPRTERARRGAGAGWRSLPNRSAILGLLGLSAILMFATISVEPIITVHVEHLTGTHTGVALIAAIIFSLTALGTIISGPQLGTLADRVGHLRVLSGSLIAATVLLATQGLVGDPWSFGALRFLTGLALGGVTPTIMATLRGLVPEGSVGAVLGINVSAQYVGQVSGPLLAGWLGGVLGTGAVFLLTAAVTAIGLGVSLALARRLRGGQRLDPPRAAAHP